MTSTVRRIGEKLKPGIEYADKSWNPFTGCLMVGCAVGRNCWAYKMSQRMKGRFGYDKDGPFKPTFHPDKLNNPIDRKKPTRYDTCFMGDIAFAKTAWLNDILYVVLHNPRHRFYFLTKRPDILGEKNMKFPKNAWVGVTVNSQDDIWRIANLKEDVDCHVRYISHEPVYGPILVSYEGIDWIIIGAQTNPDKQPKIDWVLNIIDSANYRNIPVFTKPNLKGIQERREFPKEE